MTTKTIKMIENTFRVNKIELKNIKTEKIRWRLY